MNWFRKRRKTAQISRINNAFQNWWLSDRVHLDEQSNTIVLDGTLEPVEIRRITQEIGSLYNWDWECWEEDWVFVGGNKVIKLEK